MKKIVRATAVITIMVVSLLGAMLTSALAYADYPPPPEGMSQTVFTLPHVNESSPWAMAVSTYNSSGGDCDAWHNMWDNGWVYPAHNSSALAGSWILDNTSVISRLILAYDTSSLPDDAVIFNGSLRIVPAYWFVNGTIYTHYRIFGVNNSSVFPYYFDGEIEEPAIQYNESEFWSWQTIFGEFSLGDCSLPPYEWNDDPDVYFDVPLYHGWGEGYGNISPYINKSGITALGIRDYHDDMGYCPLEMQDPEEIWGHSGIWIHTFDYGDVGAPETVLVLNWYIPPHEGIVSPTVSPLLVILGLIFASLGVMGILGVLIKGEHLPPHVRVGLLMGFTIFVIVGILIVQQLIVTVTSGTPIPIPPPPTPAP